MPRLLLLLSLCLLASCSSGGNQSLSAVNDDLRAKNLALQKQTDSLTHEVGELKAKLAEANTAAKAPLPQDVLDALPRCAEIKLDSLSGFERKDNKPRALFYITPSDGRGRFVQIVGTLSADATYLPSQQAAVAPRMLATVTLTPAQLRDAYRSNFTGTHYTIELDLPPDTPMTGDVTLRVHFTDALTGETLHAQLIKPLR